MPTLVVKSGPTSGRVYALNDNRVSVGRAPDNTVWLDDRTISRYHAVLTGRGSAWQLKDLSSCNGILVNGRSAQTVRLAHGDHIQLGNVLLEFVDPALDGARVVSERKAADLEITQIIRLDDARRRILVDSAVEGEVARQASQLHSFLALADLALSAKTVPALLDGLVHGIRAGLQVERVVPLLRDEDGVLRAYVADKGDFAPDLTGLDIDVGVLEKAQEQGPVAARGGAGPNAGVACVPIRVGSSCFGVFYCSTSDASAEFSGEDLHYLFCISVSTGLAIEKIRSEERMAVRTRNLTRQLEERYDMVGESEAIQAVYSFISKVAPTNAGVFICGESGTGKEMVARAIHHHSRRSEGLLEIVNCGAVPEGLLESELFGHVRGAFTGAVAGRPGRFELADGGTLFLDEVAELPPHCQTKLLRVLEEGKVRRVGDTRDRTVDVRLIAATNRDPQEAVTEGRLRADLFYRLDRLRIFVPPLRRRLGDIPVLAAHFLEQFSLSCKRHIEGFTPEVHEVFASYDWPGNVRELRNVVERMVILGEGPVLGVDLVPQDIRGAVPERRAEPVETLADAEKRQIIRALQWAEGNKKKAAEVLGIDRSTLYAKLHRYEIES